MRVLLVYPQYPDTFWSFKHALKFVSKKAAFPPLGLLTVAAMLPREWDKKLIDMNVTNLNDREIEWADYVFISAMAVQKDSAENVIRKCKNLGTKVVAGGPLFTTGYEEFVGVDHFVLNEAELTLPPFLEDLRNGCVKHVYTSDKWADITTTPIPSWELIDMKKYSSMSIQYSRGCPFDCEFCDIVVLNGHTPRTKSADQLLKELDEFHTRGWRSSVFIVDDNFIGNKRKLKTETLPAIIEWIKKRKKPFSLFTEASINLADDEELVRLMVEANFNMVFIGIETTNEESLVECKKSQNRNRDLVASVRKLQNHGLQVQGGFILGFDNDPASIFESLITFIQRSGIVTAMVGLLNAPRGTKLYRRLKKEKRLLSDFSGDNTDCTMNFIPRMEYKNLINGYKKVIDTIYSPKQYYERIKTFLEEYKPVGAKIFSPQFAHLMAFVKSVWFLGIIGKGRQYYWRLLAWTLARRPKSFSMSVILAIYGFHFRKVVKRYIITLARDNGSRA
ncbi:MAG: B12-binding domain-containing radical SAM protein [Chloroflexi bacterium RBG_19FT_COMBO_48_23]|nr:MAG: B12-binding domain-containing radical SAM protein [Chloroflexi bacterium RBG_19FT_COMBO_48_23]